MRLIKFELFTPKATASEKENVRLQSIPRFTHTMTNLFDKRISLIDAASYLFIYDELFNKEIYKFRTENKQPFIIDCGANIGLSIIYFKQLYPDAEILAFEPDEKVFATLELNVESFQLTNVNLIKKACWSEETTLKFYSERADGGRLLNDEDSENIIEVKTTQLQKYLNRKVDFLKIDIEGAEVEVISDIKDQLMYVENIFVEYHSFVRKEQHLPNLLAILKNAGFRLHISTPGLAAQQPFIKIPVYANMDNQINIYGFRENKNV